MLTFGRNALITVAATVVAVFVGAGAQEGFQQLWPALSDRILGSTSIGTYIGGVSLGATFFAVGYLVPKWLRSRAPFIWLVAPALILYAVAVTQSPYLYRCSAQYMGFCVVVHSVFVAPILACALGYALRCASRSRVIA
jgi:hypothetical protein